MGALHVGEDLAAMVVVLNKISLLEAHAEGLPGIHVDAVYRYRGNGVILRPTTQNALYPALTGGKVIQCGRGKSVCPTGLPGHLPGVIQCRKLWHGRVSARPKKSKGNAGVDLIILQALVQAGGKMRAL